MSTSTTSGATLPDATRLGGVRLQIADLDRSVAFYTRVLGLVVLSRDAGRAALGVPGSGTPLVELVERPGAASVAPRGRLGLYHFAILLPDRASLGRLVRHLAALGVRAGASDHLVSEALYLSDPDGLGIEVYADRPRDAWPRADDGGLAMATDPLDFQSLLRAAGDVPWTGMPAGTTLGHVHLHVGDLAAAEAFYAAALGFDVVVRRYPGALFVSAGGYHHHLGVNTWAGPHAAPAGDGDARLLAWTLVLPDAASLAAAAERLERAGAAVERRGDGFRTRDPWGTAVHVDTGTA